MKKIKQLHKSKFSTILIILFIVAVFTQHLVFAPLAKAAVDTSQGWEGNYNWSGKNIILKTANGEIIFSLDSTTGNDVNFSAKKWLDSVYQNRLGLNSPAEEDLHISLIKGDDPRQAKLWCRYISTYAVDTKMLPSACAANSSNDYLYGNIEIKNVKNGDTELNKELGLIGCPPQKKKDGNKNYACLGGGAVVDGKYDKDGKPPENPKRTGEEDDGAETANQSQEANCSQALSPFGWVLCPATNFADNLYSFFKTLVNNLLFFESDKYENNGLYDSWKVMVTLANTVLVLVAIVMIAAQIFNFEFISAYTVKKALPRIVIAAILIQLSWFMVTTGIQIVNAIGSGLYWLLVAPFASKLDFGNTDGILEMGPILAQNYSGTDKGNTVGNAVVFYYAIVGLGAAAVGAAVSGLWISIIIAAIGVVISLLVAIVTLVIREVLLIVLIAIAPLAIAFWILPGTNGLWNMWWKTFSKLLLMYPLIMLLFAGGTIAAILLASTGSGINILFAIIAFFAPMFMIGATYKFAGGAFASIANMTGKIGDKAKGSGMFGLKETAKRKREQSPWSLASQARKEQHRIEANKKFADLLGKDSPYGAVLRRKSGGGNVETIIARAQQQQIKDKSEDIDRIVSGDTSVLRDIVNNTARGPASAFNNDTYARIAAFQQLAKMGKTDASDFSSIGRMLRDDDVLRNKIVGDAAFASGQAGNLTDGKIQSVSGTGEITYKDRIPDSASATANAIRNMPQEQLRFLATETVRDPKTGRDIDRFKDANTRTYFDTREGAAYAVQLLTDPASSQNLTVNQKNVLRQQALRHGLTIPSSPNSGATQVPNPPHGPGTSGGTP